MIHIVVLWIAAVAVFVMNDSTAITSQAIVVRVDSDSDWVGGDELLQSLVADHIFLVPSAQVVETSTVNVASGVRTIVLTSLIATWVGIPVDNTLLFGELVCISHPAAVATPVDRVTVQQVLHGVSRHLVKVVLNCIQALKRGRRGEGPAGAAAALVHRLGHLALLVPIDIVGEVAGLDHVRPMHIFIHSDQ